MKSSGLSVLAALGGFQVGAFFGNLFGALFCRRSGVLFGVDGAPLKLPFVRPKASLFCSIRPALSPPRRSFVRDRSMKRRKSMKKIPSVV